MGCFSRCARAEQGQPCGAEHEPENRGLSVREHDIRTPERPQRLDRICRGPRETTQRAVGSSTTTRSAGRTSGGRCIYRWRSGFHLGGEAREAIGGHSGEQSGLVVEVAIRRVGRDTHRTRGLAEAEALGAPRGHERAGRGDQRRPEIAVVVGVSGLLRVFHGAC